MSETDPKLRDRTPSESSGEHFLRGRRTGRTPMPLRENERSQPRDSATTGVGTLRAGYTPGEIPPYRRRAVKPRRKRQSFVVQWLRPVGTAALLAAVLAALGAWLATSPRFQVAAVEVRGEDPVLNAWVEERVTRFAGERLLMLPLGRVSDAVGPHPWIDRLEVSRVLPDHLSVEVHERRPVALLDSRPPEPGGPSELVYADREGRSIAPVSDPGPGAPDLGRLGDLLHVRGGWGESRGVPEALEIRGELIRAQPDWGAAVTEVEILGESDFRLVTTALRFPIVVRAGEVAPKVRWLERLLPRLVERFGEPAAVDLRFARRIVLEHVVETTSERSPERGA